MTEISREIEEYKDEYRKRKQMMENRGLEMYPHLTIRNMNNGRKVGRIVEIKDSKRAIVETGNSQCVLQITDDILEFINMGDWVLYKENNLEQIIASCIKNPDKTTTGTWKKASFDVECRNIIIQKAKIIQEIRNFLIQKCFIEIKTPFLVPKPEISPLRQFITYHPQLGILSYIREAPTEYLKKYLVSNFPKVFEFATNVRSEKDDGMHTVEFTALEITALSYDVFDMVALTGEIIDLCARTIGKGIAQPIQRIDFCELCRKVEGLSALSDDDILDPQKLAKEIGYDGEIWNIYDYLFDGYIIPMIQNEEFVFIYNYPYYLSGPAKALKGSKRRKERAELFFRGIEIANMSTHLNDPMELLNWHLEQIQRAKHHNIRHGYSGAIEHQFDPDLFEAMFAGLPPAAIVGIGVERLLYALIGEGTIKDYIFEEYFSIHLKEEVISDE